MVLVALFVHNAGFTGVFESENMLMIEKLGAFGIIGMGIFAGYKGLWPSDKTTEPEALSVDGRLGFLKGLMTMATYSPQALVFYGLIVPKTVEPQLLMTVILSLGVLKTTLIFGWHSVLALLTTRAQNWIENHRMGKPLELSTAYLIVVLGVKILV